MNHDVFITGLPRSGTTLVCHLLSSLPDVVALHEPIRVLDLGGLPPERIPGEIDAFAERSRASLLAGATAMSKQIGGAVPDNPIAAGKADDGLRKPVNELGEIAVTKPLSPDFVLAIKHNAFFTAFLGPLAATRRCFAIVRNPLAVLASWQSVDLPVNRGRLPAATLWDAALAELLERTPDVVDRQFHILDWFFRRFADALPAERIVRYEEVVATGGRCLAHLVPQAASLDGGLRSRNRSSLYDPAHHAMLGRRLLDAPGIWDALYPRDEIEALLKAELDHAAG